MEKNVQNWTRVALKEVGDIQTGSTPPTSNSKNYGDEYPFYGPSDLGKTKFIDSSEKWVSELGYSISRKIPIGSILFSCIGNIGKMGITTRESTCNQQINWVFPKETVDLNFLYYSLYYSGKSIAESATTQVVPMIKKSEFEKIEINVPRLKEQQAIAEALSDIDELIHNLTTLLKKKILLFEGTRHELLSGKRRLPSYANDWKLTKVADLVTVDWGNTNLTKASYKNGGQYLAVSATGIDGHIDHFEHEAYVPVISAIGALCGKMMLPKSKFVAIKNTITLTPFKNKVDGAFIFHFFNYCRLPIRGGAQPFISKGDVENFEIFLPIESPDSYQEQKEIGSILEDMSSEIDEIKFSIQKCELLKQGMINDLLTGKVG